MSFDDVDIGTRRRGEPKQVVAVFVIEIGACVEQEEFDLPVAESLAGRLETGHAQPVGADGRDDLVRDRGRCVGLHSSEDGCDLGSHLVTRRPDVHAQDVADELLRAVRQGRLERRQRDLVAGEDQPLGLVPIDQALDGVCRFLGAREPERAFGLAAALVVGALVTMAFGRPSRRSDWLSGRGQADTRSGSILGTTSQPATAPEEISCSVARPDRARRSARCRLTVLGRMPASAAARWIDPPAATNAARASIWRCVARGATAPRR